MRNYEACAVVALAAALLVACGDDDSSANTTSSSGTSGTGASGTSGTSGGTSGTSGGTSGTSGTSGSVNPAPPALGTTQIDRMGRPAVNTALNNAFNADATSKGLAKDAYNGNADQRTWINYTGEIEKNLAILDALDGVCGNQVLADTTKTDPSRYAPFATVISDDRLWVDSRTATCTTYLGVEAAATNILPNTDCGGRKPNYEVIKLTYTLTATGQIGITITDGTTQIPAKTMVATFPFFAAPTQ
jgi:hypothetical protein